MPRTSQRGDRRAHSPDLRGRALPASTFRRKVTSPVGKHWAWEHRASSCPDWLDQGGLPGSGWCLRVNGRNLVLLANAVKNYRAARLLACRQSVLLLSSNGRAKARVERAWWPEAYWPRAPHVAKGPRESESFVLGTYSGPDGGEGGTY